MSELSTPRYIWFDGMVRPWGDARVHVWTEVVLRAASVFEGIRGYWHAGESRHYVLHLADHVRRMAESAQFLRIPGGIDTDEMLKAISELLVSLDYREDVYIRPTLYLTHGRYSANSSAADRGFFVPIFPVPREPTIDTGITCQVSSWRRADDTTLPPRVKTAANYANFRLARIEATAHHYDEAILLSNTGHVAETGGACVFVVRRGQVCTPPVGASILESLTRRSAIDLLGGELGIPVAERAVERSELYTADEIFVTGTLCEITPVIAVDGLPVGSGSPGPVTRALQERYSAACRAGRTDQRGWLTPGPVLAKAQR